MLTARDGVDARIAVVQGGGTAGDLVAAAREHNLTPVTGTVRTVGITGLTPAGGYGPLCGAYGLALDNLLSADVILADGRRVVASPEQDADLCWALYGAGALSASSPRPVSGCTSADGAWPPGRDIRREANFRAAPGPGFTSKSHEESRFLRLMVRAGAIVDNIWVVSAYLDEGLGRVMGLFGGISQELSFRDVICELFGENQVVVVKLNSRDLLVVAEEVTI